MSYETLFQNALHLHESGRLDEAEAVYRQILQTTADQPDVLNLLGLVAQAKGAQDEACRLFMRALKVRPDNAVYYYNLAFSYKLNGHLSEALENFRKAAQINPQIKETYNEIGLLLQQLGNMAEARLNWEYAAQLDASYAEAKANLAMSYGGENIAKAQEDLETLAAAFPAEGRVFYYLTDVYMQRGLWQEAWSSAAKAKELAPTSDEVRVQLALLCCHEKQFDNAKIYYAKAELLNPRNLAALSGLADIYSREGNFDEAEKRYRRLLELQPKNFEFHHNYAEMLQRAGRLSEALEEYRAAVLISPQAAEPSNNLALILRGLGEYEEALGLLFNALAHQTDMEEISVNLSETLIMFARQNLPEAQKIADNWLKSYPENAFAKHTAAALKGENIGNHQIYSEKLFDHFADNYEHVVQTLGYAVPLVMGRIAGSLEGTIVDLGCGTGLVGAALKTPRNQIIGVDLSQKMLDVAAQKKVYAQLVKSDALDYLRRNQNFDWVVAGDVAGYIGALDELIKSIRNKNIIISVEVSDKAADYALNLNGRYQHRPEYVEKLLRQNGFSAITQERFVMRFENGEPVNGIVFKGEHDG